MDVPTVLMLVVAGVAFATLVSSLLVRAMLSIWRAVKIALSEYIDQK